MNLNPDTKTALETNGPIIAAEMVANAEAYRGNMFRAKPRMARYVIVCLGYNRENNYIVSASTPKQAMRAIAHVIHKHFAGRFACSVVTPDNRVFSYIELRNIIREEV